MVTQADAAVNDTHLLPVAERLPARTTLGILMGLCVLLLLMQFVQSTLFSVLALGFYAWYCKKVASYTPTAFVLLLWFLFSRLTTMLSGVAIESGGYMPEMMVAGHNTGGFVRLAMEYVVVIWFATVAINACMQRVPRPPLTEHRRNSLRFWVLGIFALTLFLCAWAFLIGLVHGFPLLENANRFVYWKQVSSRFLFFFLGNRPILATLLGLVYATQQGWRKKGAIALIVLILFISFLFAEKFTSICLILFSFVTPVFLLDRKLLNSITVRMVPLGILVAAITLPAILAVYGVFTQPRVAVERLQARATSQAELWYMVDNEETAPFKFDSVRVKYNLASLVSLDPDSMSRTPPFLGARDFMSQYLDKLRYLGYIERGTTLTLATEAYLLRMFGFLGMIPVYWFLMAVYALQLAYLAYGIFTYNPLRIIVAAKLLVWSTFGLNQGYFWNVVGIQVVAAMVAVGLVESLLWRSSVRQAQSVPGQVSSAG